MKSVAVVLVGGLLFLACGVTEDPLELDPLSSQEQASCTVSTQCANGQTLQCSGSACNSQSGSFVTCDNTTSYCGCLINGVLYSHGALNPDNDCQRCDSTVSNTSWTNRNGYLRTSVCKPGGVCGFGACSGYPCSMQLPCRVNCVDGEAHCGG